MWFENRFRKKSITGCDLKRDVRLFMENGTLTVITLRSVNTVARADIVFYVNVLQLDVLKRWDMLWYYNIHSIDLSHSLTLFEVPQYGSGREAARIDSETFVFLPNFLFFAAIFTFSFKSPNSCSFACLNHININNGDETSLRICQNFSKNRISAPSLVHIYIKSANFFSGRRQHFISGFIWVCRRMLRK